GGHSYGELVALATTGAIDEDDLLDLSRRRADSILDAVGEDPGTMAAVDATAAEVRALLGVDRPVVLANDNAPGQVVVSGPTEPMTEAVEALRTGGLDVTELPVACAFHSPLVSGATVTLASALADLDVRVPDVPVWANTTAEPYPADPLAIRRVLAAQVGSPVRFREQIESMYDAGARIFVEAGPGRVLTGLVDKILGDRPHVAVAIDAAGENGVRRLLSALAELAVNGVAVDLEPLFEGRDIDRQRRDAPGPARGWLVNGSLVKTAEGTPVAGGLQPVSEAPSVVLANGPSPRPGASSERDAAVLEYLRGARELMAAERDVMLSYLGGTVAPSAPVAPVDVPAAALSAASDPEPSVAAAEAVSDAAGAPPGPPPDRDAVLDAVLAIVAERTGYPPEMLDPDLDLEADLSIDSIKRIEIVGELADRIGLPGSEDGAIDESVVEELAQLKTLNGIVDWIEALGDRDDAPVEKPPAPDESEADTGGRVDEQGEPERAEATTKGIPETVQRYVVDVIETESPPDPVELDLSGRRIGLVDDVALDRLGDALRGRLGALRLP
ncbi:MAG: acyltransferase domain-containing protein, partial [Actinomycetota bacterium]